MTYTFRKGAQGGNVGNSICENDKLDLALEHHQESSGKGVNLVPPTDCSVAADAFANDAHTTISSVKDIPEGWEGLDIGPASDCIVRRCHPPRQDYHSGTVLPACSRWTTSQQVRR